MSASLANVKPFIVFGKPDISELEKSAVLEVLDSGWLSTGKKVKEFEDEFSKFIGVDNAIAVSSCTDGLILSLLAAGVGYGHEVITSPLTFAATANAILAVGARPVFADVLSHGCIDPSKIGRLVTHKTRAVIPVHYTGQMCDMNQIIKIAKLLNLWVIEDCAHMFGSPYVPKGDFAVYSFYPTKNITSGEGGMVVTKDSKDADSIRILSMQGLSAGAHERYGSNKPKNYSVIIPGRKSNMSDIHAAIGLTQLRRWPEIKGKREKIWNVYESEHWKRGDGHSKHLFTVWSEQRDELREFLHKKGIGTGIHFNPLHLEPGYEFLEYQKGDFPEAERIGRQTLSLPVSSTMVKEDAEFVWETFKSFKSYRGDQWI
jgi:dTDP-4-amino-4,6-dideoxygalactose transaminase